MKQWILIPCAALLASCGTILHGSRQDIEVQSSPAGARVETAPAGGVYATPTTLRLERKSSYVLTFTAPGYQPATFNVHNSIGAGTVVADVLLTGLVGVVVDGLTGSWYGLSPEAATVTLTKLNSGGAARDAIHVSVGSGESGRRFSVTADAPGVTVLVRKLEE